MGGCGCVGVLCMYVHVAAAKERSVYLREKAAGASGAFAYWFSLSAHLLSAVPSFSVFLVVIYCLVHLNWEWGAICASIVPEDFSCNNLCICLLSII